MADYDYQTESVVNSTTVMLNLAATTPALSFPLVASAALPLDYENEGSSGSYGEGYQTSTDKALSAFSTPVSMAVANSRIRSFIGQMPSGPRKAAKVNAVGWHRSTVPLTSTYQEEKTDPTHRMGDLIRDFASFAPANVNLFAWMDSLSYFEVCACMRQLGKTRDFITTFAPAFMRGVKYLDAASRVSYRVDAKDGILNWGGRSLDTKAQKLETVFSGVGWGIWVLSPGGEFYTASHKKGEFHHSSFLSGEPVKAAGEWLVKDGRIELITGKTGHYKCNIDALIFALRQLSGMDALPATSKVIAWKNGVPQPVLAHAFLKDPAMQSSYVAFGAKPLNTPERSKEGWSNGNVSGQQKPSMLGASRGQPSTSSVSNNGYE